MEKYIIYEVYQTPIIEFSISNKVGVLVNQHTMALIRAPFSPAPSFPVTPALCYLMSHEYQNV